MYACTYTQWVSGASQYIRRTQPCNRGILGIEDPNIITIIPYSDYYWVGGPPNQYTSSGLRTHGLRIPFLVLAYAAENLLALWALQLSAVLGSGFNVVLGLQKGVVSERF